MRSPYELPQPLTRHGDWQLHAACRGMDVNLFFQPDHARGAAKHAQDARAKTVCAACPVRRHCLDWALTVKETSGVWGGLTPQERARPVPRHAA